MNESTRVSLGAPGIPKKRRVFLHLGSHKTGTTSIQWTLSAGRSSLAEHGICYPQTGCPEWAEFGQHLLAWSVVTRPNYLPNSELRKHPFDEDSRAALWEGLRSEIDSSGAHTVVLSSEELDILCAEEVAALGRELKDYDVTPVVFLRNVADMIESAYRTFVVHGGCTKSIEQFASNQRTRLDYYALASDWSLVARDGEVIICAYDDPSVRSNVVGVFCDIIGVELHAISRDDAPRQNESFPAFICELLRFLRLKQCGENSVRRWLDDMRKVQFSSNANQAYSFVGAELREQLVRGYLGEVDRILASPALRNRVRGDLLHQTSAQQPSVISNTVLAILALGRDLGHRS